MAVSVGSGPGSPVASLVPSSSLTSGTGSVVVGVGAFASPRSNLSLNGPDVALIPSAGGLAEIVSGAVAGVGAGGDASVDLVGDDKRFSAEAGCRQIACTKGVDIGE